MWTKEQQLAIDKQDSNILVSASAGSGKTAVLVERVINKVIKYKIDIDKILVVTFTNAAAIELKERLLLAIYEALSKNRNDKFLRRQLTYINRASITTLHSFCLDIIRQNFQLLDLDPNFKICDETESNILRTRAINKVLEEEYIKSNEDVEIKDKLYNILELFGGKDENLIEYILKIYSYIQSFAFPLEWLKEKIDKYNLECDDLCDTDFGKSIYLDSIKTLESLIRREEEILEMIEGREDFLKHTELLEDEISSLKLCILNSSKNWDSLYLAINNFEMKKAPTYRGENKELKEMVLSFRSKVLKKSLDKLKKSIYEKTDIILKDQKEAYPYISYIYDFILRFDKEYQILKTEKGYLDFNDIEHLALNLLVEKEDGKLKYSEVANNLKEKFKEVYTDEYQDISFIQEAILDALSCNNNRFMVGDIKQSIYKFRQAMPDIFNEKYDTYTLIDNVEDKNRDVKIVLAKNFRSRKEVLASINYIFEKIMSKTMGECTYEDLEILKFGATDYLKKENCYATELNILDLKKEEKSDYEYEDIEDEASKYIEELKKFEIESLYVAKKIKEMMGKYETYNIKKKEWKNIRYKDIVILLRSMKDKGNILEEALKKQGIPAFCDVSSNLFESEEIYLVLSLLRILDNPYQDIHLVSIMYSIIGNFSLDELIYIRKLDKKSRVYDNLISMLEILRSRKEKEELEDFELTLLTKLEKFLKVLDELKEYSKVNNISDLIIKIYDITNVYRQYILDNNAKQRKSNLDKLIDVAIKCQELGILTLSEYIAYVNNLKDKVDASNSSARIIGENEDVVRIMTIHKSKGLEFPYVILCDTSKKYNLMDASSTITLHHDLGIGINIVNQKYKISYPSVIKQAIKTKIETETKSEELRMLYVALTRAKEKLIIFATVKDYEKFNLNQLVIYNDEGKITPQIVTNNNSYFENINMALKDYDFTIETEKRLFDKNVIFVNEDTSLKELNKEKEEVINIYEIIKENNKYSKEEVKKELETVKEELEYTYDYLDEVTLASRVSVSELKKEDIEENNILEEKFTDKSLSIEERYKRPTFLEKEEEKYSATRKGTLVHFILENLDMKKSYNKSSLNEFLNTLITTGVIDEEDKKHINISKILKFLESDLGSKIKESSLIKKEQEFVLKDKNISKSVIQGVIDLYFEDNDNNIVLLDFKTDRLSKEEEYTLRYKKQMMIYKVALEKILKREVKNTYIYSFFLDKKIEVKFDE